MRGSAFLFAAAFAVCACTGNFADQIPVEKKTVETSGEFIPGEMVVKLSEEYSPDGAIASSLSDAGVLSVERLYPDAGEWEERHRKAGLHLWYRLKYNPGIATATKAAADIALIDGVEYAEPSRRIVQTAIFNDPLLPKQWGYINDGASGGYKKGMDINVLPVWQNYTGGTSNVVVAVVDGGVDFEHPDLEGVVIPSGPNGSQSFINGRGTYIPPHHHGTHVAGTIAAINNNGIGVCGVAGGLDGKGGVSIMSCEVFRETSGDDISGNHSEAIVWAADHGAVICQNSWSYIFDTESQAASGSAGSVGSAIDYFVKYAGCDKEGNQLPDSPMKGGVVFFSAGNDGWAHGWPAEYDGCIAVGAIAENGTRAGYSNYGDWVDICAPGGDLSKGTAILSTVPGADYQQLQGTSMACPHVSGVAALLVSYFGGPGFTNQMLLDRMLQGANPVKVPFTERIGPLVDAYGAFSIGGAIAPEPVNEVELSVNSNLITASWAVTSDEDDIKAYGFQVLLSKSKDAIESYTPGTKLPSSIKGYSALSDSVEVGGTVSYTAADLEFETEYFVSVVAYDYCGNYAGLSPIRSITTQKNNAPVISTEYQGDFVVKTFETLEVLFDVADPDGHSFEVKGETGSDAATFTPAPKGRYSFRIVGKNAPEGYYIGKIIATDQYGAESVYVINYRIYENHAPVVVREFEPVQLNDKGQTLRIDLKEYFNDEDEEALKYTATLGSKGVATFYFEKESLLITALDFGLTDATITATDAAGKNCSSTFKLLVRDDSRPVDLYPNPVTDNLYVRPGIETGISVSITNKAGTVVFQGEDSAGPFDPCVVDMSGIQKGTYYVHVSGGSIDVVYPIVKL